MTKENNLPNLQESSNKEIISKTLTIAEIIKSMMAKFGEQVLEEGDTNETDNSKRIENGEKFFTLSQIKLIRAKANKQFEASK